MARDALHRLGQEMATSISMGLLPNGGELQSGVVYPDYAPVLTSPFGNDVFRREHIQRDVNGTPLRVDRAYNRLIFTTPGKKANTFTDSIAEYIFVDFAVLPKPSDPRTPSHQLVRRTFRVTDNPLNVALPGFGFQGNYLVVSRNFFQLDPGDPLGNTQQLEAGLTLKQRRERCLVLELPDSNDQIEFSVEHHQADAVRTRPLPRDPAFQPALFTVTAKISLGNQGNGKFLASHILSQQVTLKSSY